MAQIALAARAVLLILALGTFLMCPLLFVTALFAPRALGFLDGAICPDGMQLGNATSQQTNDEGNEVTAVNSVCTAEGAQPVDVTAKMLLILFAFPVLAVIVLVVRQIIPAQRAPAGPASTAA